MPIQPNADIEKPNRLRRTAAAAIAVSLAALPLALALTRLAGLATFFAAAVAGVSLSGSI